MHSGRSTWVAVALVALMLAACGSDSSDSGDDGGSGSSGGTGTELSIEGAVTSGPDGATEVDITGTIHCDDDGATGTGVYEDTAADICPQLPDQRGPLRALSSEARDEMICSEVYGGPQHATITGTIDGRPIDVDVARNNGCGIDIWESLEWLLGPPER